MSHQNEPLVINIINSIGRGAKIIFDILATLIYLPLYYLFLMSTTGSFSILYFSRIFEALCKSID